MRQALLLGSATLLACASSPPPIDAQAPAAVSAPTVADENEDPDAPRYRPSSSSPEPVDITTNAYGAYSDAPDAPAIGDVAEDFVLPLADGGSFDLSQARKAGPVLVMFYRGFW